MTLTRLAFFKLLGAIGLGQAAQDKLLVPPQSNRSQTPQLWSWGIEPTLKSGEERCPIGHAQKPRFDNPPLIRITAGKSSVWPTEQDAKVVVCSVCGIVYVPLADKEKP